MSRVVNSGVNSLFELLSGNAIFKTFPQFLDVAIYTYMQYDYSHRVSSLTNDSKCDVIYV